MAGTLTPTPFQTVLDDTGVASPGALIYTYTAGTTTAAATYTTSALSVANANPIVADSAGRYVAYLAAGANMKFVYKTAAGATIRTQDNVLSVPGAAVNLDIQGTVGVAVTAGQVCYLSSGAEATPLTPGLWYLTDADFAVSSTTCQSIGMAVSAIPINTAGTIRLAGLADTAAAVVVGSTYYVSATAGAITTTAPALSRVVGVADTTSTLILAATSAVVATLPNPISQDLLFTDATYDIGKLGASRPRDLFQSRNATIGGTLGVTGAATLSSTVATGALTVTGAATVSTTLGVTGATTLSSTVGTGALTVTGNETVSGTLGVTGATTLSSTVATGALTITGGATYTTNLKSTTAFATPAALTATQATAFASTVSGASLMGFGTTNDVALMNRAGTVVLGIGPNTTTVNMTGLLSVTGFGAHSFSASGTGTQSIELRNSTAGASNNVLFNLGTDTSGAGELRALSSTYTTSGPLVQNSVALVSSVSGGLSLAATNAAGAIRFYSGGTTLRLTIPSDSAGIQFPATQAASTNANTLDDYEEGNWSPVIGGTGGQSGQVFSAQEGRYIKIGRLVWVGCYVALSTLGTITGAAQITGLPFLCETGELNRYTGTMDWGNMTTSYIRMSALVNQNTSIITINGLLVAGANSRASNIAQADMTATTNLSVAVCYMASA